MASDDYSIALATISPDCNIEQLEHAIHTSEWFDIAEHMKVSSWIYTQFYGGGSDEHYAHFRSSDENEQIKFGQA